MLGRYLDLGNPVSDHPLNRGLVAWWLGLPNNSGGTRLHDLKGARPGTLTNGPTWTGTGSAAGDRSALRFDGSNDYVAVSTSPVTANPVTVCGWVYPLSASTGNTVISLRGSSGGDGWWLNVFEGTWRYKVRASGADNAVLGGTVSTSRWQFVCGVSAANNDHRLYVNGVQVATDTGTYAVAAVDNVALGAEANTGSGAGGNPLSGWGADWPVYNRALSASEVFALYEQGLRGHPGTLRRWSRKVTVFGGVAAGGGGGGNRRRRVILCGGR